MSTHVRPRPASKKPVPITPQLRQLILALLGTYSQQRVARDLGISQNAVHRVAKAAKEAAP